MTQSTTQTCTNCRTSIPSNMRFCPNCGATANAGADTPAKYAPTQTVLSPPQTYPQQQQAYQLPPAYARSQKKSVGRILKVGVLLLLLLLVLATAGYVVLKYVGSRNGSQGNTGTGSPSSAVTTTPLNATVIYASVTTTIVNVQQAQHFSDETTSSDPGMSLLRLNLKEQAPGKVNTYLYTETTHLVLPDGTILPLFHQQYTLSPEAGIVRTSWIDFAVAPDVQVSHLILRLGKEAEAQMDIPLKPQAALGQYQATTVSLHAQARYASLNWTVTSATAAFSANGVQADTGMLFVTVMLQAENPTSTAFSALPSDYLRLQSGSTTHPPTDSTFPTEVSAGQTNTMGTASFLMPQGRSSFTLIFAANVSSSIAQATTTFSIH